MTTTSLIELSNLEVKRGPFTLDIASWQVAPGQVIGLHFAAIRAGQAINAHLSYGFHQGAVVERAEGPPVRG